jgi:3-oxoacyl-[acyl-carrier-protein] synthase II
VDYPPYTIPQFLAGFFGIYGPNLMLPNACAAGNFSLGYAVHAIKSRRVEAVVAGGVDAFSRVAYSGFSRLGAISPDLPRPFSINRRGMVPGEGAAALMVESLKSAQERDAHIYAEIIGIGESCDAHHITQPHFQGVMRAMKNALVDAKLEPGEISFVSVHGTGTPTNDFTETRALKAVLGSEWRGIPVTSIKSMIGHPMGAASSIECVLSLLAIEHQFIPPTTNFEGVDPECDIDCVPNQGRDAEVNYIMKSSSAFGGNNSCVIFKAFSKDEELVVR